MGKPVDDERTVADVRGVHASRALTDEEATRVDAPRPIDSQAIPTVVAGAVQVPALRELRARDKERLAPPVPSPPGPLPIPSAPTDPGAPPVFAASAPTQPNAIITDEEATRLAPKEAKKRPRPGPPLVNRPGARQALARIKRLTMEISAVSVSSPSPLRRRTSRLVIALFVGLGLVLLTQLVLAFSHNNAELARPLGPQKAEPGFFDRLMLKE